MALTVREALVAEIGPLLMGSAYEKTLIDKELIRNGLGDGAAEYTADTTTEDKLLAASIRVLSTLSGLKSFSEGDLTIVYDSAAIKAKLDMLRPTTEPEALKPTIKAHYW